MSTAYTLTPALVRTMPDRIRALPRDGFGRPIPWFAHTGIPGRADYRSGARTDMALTHKLCWTCGQRLGKNLAFVTGAAGAIWRSSLEPPSHRSCAMWTARACPHFLQPRKRYVDGETPVHHDPGVCCVWVSRSYRPVTVDHTERYHFGEPVEVTWLYRGEPATRRDVVLATDKTLRLLIEIAQDESEEAVLALLQAVARMRQYLPGAKDDGDPGEASKKAPSASAA
jgi:hypothetical protein